VPFDSAVFSVASQVAHAVELAGPCPAFAFDCEFAPAGVAGAVTVGEILSVDRIAGNVEDGKSTELLGHTATGRT
jgi:hypothetical protein